MTNTDKRAGLTHQVSRAVAWNALLAPLRTATEFVANIVILNILPLPHVGLLRLMSAAAASLGIWVDLGIDRSLPRFIPELEQQQGRGAVRRFMIGIFIIKTALLLLFIVAFLLLSHRFTLFLTERIAQLPAKFNLARAALAHDIVALAPWLSATVMLLVLLGSFYDGLMAYLISYFRQRAWNMIGLLGSVLQPALAATCVLLGKGIGGVLVAMVVTPMVSVALATWQVVQSLRVHDKAHAPQTQPIEPHATTPKRSLWSRFALYTTMSNVLNLSDYVVSWYFAAFLLNDLAQVALYTTGTAMVRQALALLYTPLVGIQVPFFTRVRGGDGNLPEAYAAIGRILALILIPGGVGLVLLSYELIVVQYPDYANAAVVVSILTPCLFLESFLSSSQIVLQVYERYWLLMLPRLLTFVLLPLIIWVAPHYGLLGITLAIGGGRVLMGIITALMAQRAFPLRYSWGFFARVSVATVGMALGVIGLKYGVTYLFFGTMGTMNMGSMVGTTLMARLVAAMILLLIAGCGAGTFVVLLRVLGGLEPADRQRIVESRLPLRRLLIKVL